MSIVLSPLAAAEKVCHAEQLRIWAHDQVIGALALGGYLRDDLTYDEMVDLENDMKREIRGIIEAAFDHPEAKTFITKRRS